MHSDQSRRETSGADQLNHFKTDCTGPLHWFFAAIDLIRTTDSESGTRPLLCVLSVQIVVTEKEDTLDDNIDSMNVYVSIVSCSFSVRMECITVQRLAQFLTGFALYKFSVLLLCYVSFPSFTPFFRNIHYSGLSLY